MQADARHRRPVYTLADKQYGGDKQGNGCPPEHGIVDTQLNSQAFHQGIHGGVGADAKGGGPFATLLNKKPSDLTTLSQRNEGEFPFNRVYETIDGRTMPGAHGTEQMPIWGGQWKSSASLGNETGVRGQILETILYLRSIQQ